MSTQLSSDQYHGHLIQNIVSTHLLQVGWNFSVKHMAVLGYSDRSTNVTSSSEKMKVGSVVSLTLVLGLLALADGGLLFGAGKKAGLLKAGFKTLFNQEKNEQHCEIKWEDVWKPHCTTTYEKVSRVNCRPAALASLVCLICGTIPLLPFLFFRLLLFSLCSK